MSVKTQPRRRTPKARSPHAHPTRDAAYACFLNLALYPMRESDPAQVARIVRMADVLFPAPKPSTELLPATARKLTEDAIASQPFLRAVRDALDPGYTLHVFTWPDETLALSATQYGRGVPGDWLWNVFTYECARNAPRLAAMTEQSEAAQAAAYRAESDAAKVRRTQRPKRGA